MFKRTSHTTLGILLVLSGSIMADSLPETFVLSTDTAAQKIAKVDSAKSAKPRVPEIYSVSQNYPNPFNSKTTIEYALPQQSGVFITIYNLVGEQICTLKNDIEDAGYHRVVWNGTNASGSSVSSGIYFYRVLADDFYANRKMIVLK